MSFKLRSITLDSLNQVTVASSASNAKRGYGRRFTVTMGDDSHEVVLKDLFKRAQNLTKNASSASELNEIERFITMLEGAETDAARIYKDRGCVYKFRSCFHRFFGGSFQGSHLDRLRGLKADVSEKQEMLLESFKSFFEQNQPMFISFIDNEFAIEIEGQTYDVKGEGSLADGITLKVPLGADKGGAGDQFKYAGL